MRKATNFIAFQTAWFVAMLGAANGMPWLGVGAVPFALCLHLAFSPDWRPELLLALCAAGVGFATLVIDPDRKTVIAKIPVGDTPMGIAVTPDGRKLFVTNSRSNDLTVIDAEPFGMPAGEAARIVGAIAPGMPILCLGGEGGADLAHQQLLTVPADLDAIKEMIHRVAA